MAGEDEHRLRPRGAPLRILCPHHLGRARYLGIARAPTPIPLHGTEEVPRETAPMGLQISCRIALTAISFVEILDEPIFIPVPIIFHGLIFAVGKVWPNLGRSAAFAGIILVIVAMEFQGIASVSVVLHAQFNTVTDLCPWIVGWAVAIGVWPAAGWVVQSATRLTERFAGVRNIGP